MQQTLPAHSDLIIVPVTPEHWPALEQLFGERGACGGCWCMWWRLQKKEYEAGKGATNKAALKSLVDAGKKPGLLAFIEGKPVGWCAVAPREDYPRLEKSRILKPVDDLATWSITCLYINKNHRRSGLSVRLISATVDFVKARGGSVIEGYALEPEHKPENKSEQKSALKRVPDVFAYYGLASAYRQAGFKEVVRRSPTRPIMRYSIAK